MQKISTLGIDLAKSSFVICGLDASGKQVVRKEIRRDSFASFVQNTEPCLVVMEACGSSYFWARKFRGYGHDVKLIAPQKVVGFRKCNKNDRNDALAIAIAASCPGMEFVGIKSVEQQDIQSLLRIRARLVQRQTSLVNEMRGLLAEYGLIIPEGITFVRGKLAEITARNCHDEFGLTEVIAQCARSANEELIDISNRIEQHETLILKLTKSDERCQRIQTIPGVGPMTAATIVSSIVDINSYKNGRQFSASIGLTPRHIQSGGRDSKPVQLGITKHGDPVIRSLLVQGGMTVAGHCKRRMEKPKTKDEPKADSSSSNSNVDREKALKIQKTQLHPCRTLNKERASKKLLSPNREKWMQRLIEEKGTQKTAVAIANRNARIIFSILKNGGTYHVE